MDVQCVPKTHTKKQSTLCCPVTTRLQKEAHAPFSRMRSEGFPFIVGVWGWKCVRFVFVVSSSCRRRVVVVSPLIRCRWGELLEVFWKSSFDV